MLVSCPNWWRWGESNSCPKAYPHELLRVYSVIAENSRSLAQRQTDTPVCLVGCDTSQGYSHRFVTFTTDRRLYQSRGTLRQDERWLKQQLIQNYRCRLILKRTPFKECALLYSLIVLQNPRRNLYTPRLVSLFHGTLYVTLCGFLCHVVTLVIKLFTFAKPKCKLDSAAFEI